MVERGGGFGLARESCAKDWVPRELGSDQLDGDGPTWILLLGTVNHAHAPASNDGVEPASGDVVAQSRIGAAQRGHFYQFQPHRCNGGRVGIGWRRW